MNQATSLLTSLLAAKELGVSPGTLAVWRCTGRYPLPFVKVGRSVRYRQSDIDAFIASRTITHTGELTTVVAALGDL